MLIDLQKKLEAEAEHFRHILEGEIPDDHRGSLTAALLHTIATACGLDSMEMQEMICRYAIHGKLKDDNIQECLKNGDLSIHMFDPPRNYASILVRKAQVSRREVTPKQVARIYRLLGPGKHSRNDRRYPIKDEHLGRVAGKRNIVYGLANILEKDLLSLRNISSV